VGLGLQHIFFEGGWEKLKKMIHIVTREKEGGLKRSINLTHIFLMALKG
jgi:hypothetical protein